MRPASSTTRRHARIVSVAAYHPVRSVGNAELIDTYRLDSTDAWIRARTGIGARGLAAPHETLALMGAHAAERAVRRAGLGAGDIDCVLAATMSHLAGDTSLAREIADRLDPAPRAALDVSAACAGFATGLELARCLVSGGVFRRVLLVGAERMSDIVESADRTTSVIFGDGAGAVVVEGSDEPGISAAAWGSDGTQGDLLSRAPGDPRHPPEGETRPPYLRMRGPELYRWVMAHVPENARQALKRAGIAAGELDAFIPHQANDRMITGLAKALGLPPTVAVARDVVRRGNTSAASIPLAMESLLGERPELSGGLALLSGFGAGVAYAAQVVRLP
ncbi:beta-ketoacyl-ACP synthase 3 [Streptomyces sp. NPDC050842]|uniref:beta-ketoacyl-ACP synthase 3 n=1 Tax=Streptomyces sp. NPDC050842 TaxID=3365636 RepID=UPI00378D0459